ncbi:hypothetical protein DCC85_05000 [Paenibacillus sp. CAA11]|uniref:hypothetical protein n=1 Tax=Paenibacillus sp. CAA11 TaxID=1532905 RepID=UPI000D379C50|nr:hypothetical protein [Paenibacillus sp. CAA11]AWB43643.1 hypothetical protein DCC85_05000 [Paenibacillus sp. CAA11]
MKVRQKGRGLAVSTAMLAAAVLFNACSIKDEKEVLPETSSPVQQQTQAVNKVSSSDQKGRLQQEQSNRGEQSKESQQPHSSEQVDKVYNLKDYVGTWVDQDYNEAFYDDCENAVDIRVTGDKTGSIYFFLDGPSGRVTDSEVAIKLSGNKANFWFDDSDSEGKGRGILTLEKDKIKIELKLESGNEELRSVYDQVRTFVRDPYQGIEEKDPIALMKSYAKNHPELQGLTFQYDENVEWTEGRNKVKVMIGVDSQGEQKKRYTVNVLTGNIVEQPAD